MHIELDGIGNIKPCTMYCIFSTLDASGCNGVFYLLTRDGKRDESCQLFIKQSGDEKKRRQLDSVFNL